MLTTPAAASNQAESHRCRRCHRRRPDPLAPPLLGSPAAGQSRPCRPCPTGASSCRRLNPAPPPTPARLEGKGGGKGGGCPLPVHILRSLPSLLLPSAHGHAGMWSPAAAGSLGVPRIQDYYPQKTMRLPPRDCGLCSSARVLGVYCSLGDGGMGGWEIIGSQKARHPTQDVERLGPRAGLNI